MYTYEGKVINVVDGDTIDVEIDLGFSILTHQRVRLYGIDTAEMNSQIPEEREKAKQAKERVKEVLLDKEVFIITHKTDKYGRYLANVYPNDSTDDISMILVTENLAVPYFGGKR